MVEERVRAPAAGVALELTRGGADTFVDFGDGAGVAGFAAGAGAAVLADDWGAACAAAFARCIDLTDCAAAPLAANAAAQAAMATRRTGREMKGFSFKIHSWFGTAERGRILSCADRPNLEFCGCAASHMNQLSMQCVRACLP